ncbi:LytTR family DNA-binding domain-containing protein [Phenylobacterium sp.]|jgi:DNA-binding LytR/AlgR family response regulator|uniref:LytTR family DNA-binding domain-containing protein n=1 Tax=Phenylobacterium sp. TaxID=1871053 RepID=UPI002ED9B1A7
MTAPLREQTPPAVRASSAAARWGPIVRSTVLPAVLIGSFLAFIGAFESEPMPMLLRLPFMVAISFAATVLGFLTFQLTGRMRLAQRHYAIHGALAALVMAVPMALVVWVAVNLVAPPQSDPPIRVIPHYIVISLVTSAFFCLFVAWMRRDAGRETHATAKPPKFLERLPLKLRGAEVWAVEAEDHYLRLHTSKGQDLILLRLADAVTELEGIEGAQVHRSWWVARDAIADARRGDGRATLTLKDGSEVPVSRTYAGLLRERGWI